MPKKYMINFSNFLVKRVNPMGYRGYHSPTGIYTYPLEDFKVDLENAVQESELLQPLG